MRAWCNILPMFVVRWYAEKNCERFRVDGVGVCVNPFGDVLIVVKLEGKR